MTVIIIVLKVIAGILGIPPLYSVFAEVWGVIRAHENASIYALSQRLTARLVAICLSLIVIMWLNISYLETMGNFIMYMFDGLLSPSKERIQSSWASPSSAPGESQVRIYESGRVELSDVKTGVWTGTWRRVGNNPTELQFSLHRYCAIAKIIAAGSVSVETMNLTVYRLSCRQGQQCGCFDTNASLTDLYVTRQLQKG
jgi:hypothetical protein